MSFEYTFVQTEAPVSETSWFLLALQRRQRCEQQIENMISQALVRSPVFWNCWPLLFPLNISIVKMQIGQFTHLHALLLSSSVSPATTDMSYTRSSCHARQMHKLSIHDWIADRVISSGIDRLQGWVGHQYWAITCTAAAFGRTTSAIADGIPHYYRSANPFTPIMVHHPGFERFPDSWAD